MSRRDEIVEVARELLESEGPEQLTMRAIGAKVGMRAPSLYKHIANKHELEVALITQGLLEQAATFRAATDQGGDTAVDLGRAYRTWARAHPHLYALMNDRPLPRDDLPAGVEDAAAAPVVDAVGGDADRARALWAFAHGMVTLELADRFPPDADIDLAWSIGIAGITT